jgi:hypothetical protein
MEEVMLKIGTLILGATAAIALVACGGDGEPTGTVRLALESSGSTSTKVKAVELKIAGVDVHIARTEEAVENGEEGGSWLSTNDRPGTLNLLDLRNHLDEELGELDAHGPITQVRLRLDAMDGGRVVFKDGRSCPIDTSDIDPTGIRVMHPFFVVEPEEEGDTRIVLDLDIQQSLIEDAPCHYKLLPVLSVSRIER